MTTALFRKNQFLLDENVYSRLLRHRFFKRLPISPSENHQTSPNSQWALNTSYQPTFTKKVFWARAPFLRYPKAAPGLRFWQKWQQMSWLKSFIMIREMKIWVLFEIWVKVTFFFQNSFCQVEVTQLDIESKYSIKRSLLWCSTVAADVGRCFTTD